MNRWTDEQIQNCIVGDIPPNYKPPNWDVWFMRQVYLVASKSKDPSTKIGAVITRENRVISVGYNGIPRGVNDEAKERYERPGKYMWFEHGERNAIYAASRFGGQTDGSTLYTQGVPCADCGRAVIQAGIKTVVVHLPFERVFGLLRTNWSESCSTTKIMFGEANVELRWIYDMIGVEGYADGKVIHV
jgi:dCMP deaminase